MTSNAGVRSFMKLRRNAGRCEVMIFSHYTNTV